MIVANVCGDQGGRGEPIGSFGRVTLMRFNGTMQELLESHFL